MADDAGKALAEARCRERERLSKILHDDIAGGLTAAGLSLDLLAMDVPAELAPRVREIQAILERSFDSVRELGVEFHPDPAIRFRLIPALERLARRFENRFRGKLEVRLSEIVEGTMKPAQAQACFAIAEAALDNVLRHACASRTWLTLDSGPRNTFVLAIRDDGKGFEKSTTNGGTGTLLMEYHVVVAELKLSIQPIAEGGTWVQVSQADRVLKKKRGSHEDGH